jgi:excisionase family DNA binding protein
MRTPDNFLNAKQAAKYLGFSYETVRKMFRLGQIPTIMVRTRKLTTKALLERWLEHGNNNNDDDDQLLSERGNTKTSPSPFST